LERTFKPKSLKSKLGNNMKKVLFTALVALGLVASFSGCSKKAAPVEANATEMNATEANVTVEANATEANATDANKTK